MRTFLISLILVFIGVAISSSVSPAASLSEEVLINMQIPANNADIAGVQKYSYPPSSKNVPPPILSARSVLVKDLTTNTILFQKEANIRVPIASTTKIMTALVASGYFQPNSPLTVKEGNKIGGSRVGLVAGETLSFRSLLYGMLLNSGNDAAYTIAENYPGGVLGFISAMNKKVIELNLANTHFENPAGFDGGKHYSSAADLSIITEEALKDSQLSRVFATKETEVVSLDKRYTHGLRNLNKLLSQVSGVLGVKTGYTEVAKENLVTLVERDGHRILTIVLGSDDRFGETRALIEWAYLNFSWTD